jgi:prepilin-type N-terminal cleavage/methylation domain-containing protein
MVFTFDNNLKRTSSEKGITLIEMLVVIFIIALLSAILMVDFPNIKRQFALTRAIYRMNQDLRKTQDMGFSGEQIEGINAKGYGIYINLDDANLGDKKYIMYADIDDDQKYTEAAEVACGVQEPNKDCVVEEIDFSQVEVGVVINTIENTTNGRWVDINFKPPNPTTTITNLSIVPPSINRALIIFALDSDLLKTRIISVNTSGLIEIK